jgi:multisubunit Na+/H+ antiporter MnhB subunit
VILLCFAVSAGLIGVVLTLPDPAPTLAMVAMEPLESTGVKNPVTAVLLAYRAMDTFLETVVVLLAMAGVWSLAKDANWTKQPLFGYSAESGGPLNVLARVLIPVGVIFGIYMVWTGSDHPGGKFQGAAILAAMGILGLVAGITSVPAVTNPLLRSILVFGPAVFLLAGLTGFATAGYFLAWPPGYSKAVIVLIEVALTPSLALMLGLLVAGPPRETSHHVRQ